MRKLIAALAVLVAIVIATLLTLRSGSPPADTTSRPQLDALLTQCDAGGSSLPKMYTAVSAPARPLLSSDPARALTIVRGQVANVIDGRIVTCERAFAVAQHDRRGSAVMAIGPFLDRLRLAHTALGDLIAALEAGSDATAKLTALDALMQ